MCAHESNVMLAYIISMTRLVFTLDEIGFKSKQVMSSNEHSVEV